METWNRLIAVGGLEGEGEQWKEGEGTSQRTCMNESWTWTTVWELTVGVADGWWDGCRRAKGGNLGNCNRITIKMI